jgi:hypothetical protein
MGSRDGMRDRWRAREEEKQIRENCCITAEPKDRIEGIFQNYRRRNEEK